MDDLQTPWVDALVQCESLKEPRYVELIISMYVGAGVCEGSMC